MLSRNWRSDRADNVEARGPSFTAAPRLAVPWMRRAPMRLWSPLKSSLATPAPTWPYSGARATPAALSMAAPARLQRLVVLGKALEIVMTGGKVAAEESDSIGPCEKVVPHSQARAAAAGRSPVSHRRPAGRTAIGLSRLGQSRCTRGCRANGRRALVSSRPKAIPAQRALPRARAGVATARAFEVACAWRRRQDRAHEAAARAAGQRRLIRRTL